LELAEGEVRVGGGCGLTGELGLGLLKGAWEIPGGVEVPLVLYLLKFFIYLQRPSSWRIYMPKTPHPTLYTPCLTPLPNTHPPSSSLATRIIVAISGKCSPAAPSHVLIISSISTTSCALHMRFATRCAVNALGTAHFASFNTTLSSLPNLCR